MLSYGSHRDFWLPHGAWHRLGSENELCPTSTRPLGFGDGCVLNSSGAYSEETPSAFILLDVVPVWKMKGALIMK